MSERALIVIPARMASTRFPGKPLAQIAGRAMIERVWRIAKATSTGDVLIATDDPELQAFAQSFGADVLMTNPNCLTGTDRVAEAARSFPQYTVFFSLQGDAVLTPPWVIDQVLQTMLNDKTILMATPAVRLQGQALIDFVDTKKGGSSSGTVVVFDRMCNALYFSKALIPYNRNPLESPVYRHIGLYAYRMDVLQKLNQFPEGPLERSEKLEQLRALENGIPIRVVPVDYRGRTHGSVDRPEDVTIIESIIAKEGELISDHKNFCGRVRV